MERKTPHRAPLVAIIIINYKGKDDTRECLQSLANLTYPNRIIHVVDQPFGASETERDGTAEMIRAEFPTVRVIENPVNNGFAGGNNVGIRQALSDGTDYTFLLNNDTTVEPGLLEPLVALMESDSTIGVVGPTMLYYSEPEIIWSLGGQMSERGESVMVAQGESVEMLPDTPQERDFIVGCGLLTRRTILESVGLLDERYFLYYEEADFCARVRKAGFRCVHHPGSLLWHKVSRSTGTESDLTLYYMRRNVLFYLRQHAKRPIINVARALLDSLRLCLVWTVHKQYQRRNVLLRAVRDFLINRTGKTF